MPWMPEHMYKGTMLAKLDALLAATKGRRVDFLNDLTKMEQRPDGIWDPPIEDLSVQYELLDPNPRDLTDDELAEWNVNYTLRAHELTEQVIIPGPSLQINEVAHMRKDWYTPKEFGGWWAKQDAPVEDILRSALIQAIEIAEDKQVPVVTNWLHAGSDTGGLSIKVQCFVTWTTNEVQLLIQTPEHYGGKIAQLAMTRALQKQREPLVAKLREAAIASRASDTGQIVIKGVEGVGLVIKTM